MLLIPNAIFPGSRCQVRTDPPVYGKVGRGEDNPDILQRYANTSTCVLTFTAFSIKVTSTFYVNVVKDGYETAFT